MWLVSTMLVDHWFDNLADALACYEQSPKTRTYPRLESREKSKPVDAFEYVYLA